MSQFPQQNDGLVDSYLHSTTQDSPTIGRNQVYAYPNTPPLTSDSTKRYLLTLLPYLLNFEPRRERALTVL